MLVAEIESGRQTEDWLGMQSDDEVLGLLDASKRGSTNSIDDDVDGHRMSGFAPAVFSDHLERERERERERKRERENTVKKRRC